MRPDRGRDAATGRSPGLTPVARRAAAIYSLIETAKANGFDPEDYLRRVIQQIANHPVNRIDELLPWNLDGVRARLDQRLAA